MTAWNPDYLEIYRKRVKLINLAQHPEKRATIISHYKHDPVAFINDFVTTYDPRAGQPFIPMALFPKQVDFIHFLHECLLDKQSGLVEKSRDVGASWLCCAFAAWMFLFNAGSSVGFGSRVESDVDKLGDPDSLFEKIRMILKGLPAFLLPERIDKAYMRIINSDTGSTITGGSGDNIGRGGRSSIFFKDESAHYEHPEMIEAALSANTDVQIDVSSVHGTNNVFYRRRMAGELWSPGAKIPLGKTRVFIFDWKDNPLKNQAWYDEKRKKWEDDGLLHIFAQEVDRDYSASLDRVIIPAAWVKAAIDAHKKLNINETGEKTGGLDVADEGGDKNALAVKYGIVLKYAEAWGEGDTGQTARKAIEICKEMAVPLLMYDCIGVGAGVKAETNRLLAEGMLKLAVEPFNAGSNPEDAERRVIPHDSSSPKNEDFFANLKAQAWWSLRQRFEKTYKMVTQGIVFPHEELISIDSNIPRLHEIEIELSQATRTYNGKGKMLVDKKPNGGKSPNLADAIVMCYNPRRTSRGLFGSGALR